MIVRIVATLLLLVLSQFAHADGVARTGDGNMIVFKDAPCKHEKVLALIKPEYRDQFKQAAILWQGKGFAACWAVHGDDPDTIVVVDETGDSGAIPRRVINFDERV